MISRKIAGTSAASVGAATAVAALLLGTVSGNAQEDVTASAFGLAADGLLPIDPTPLVVAPPDGEEALIELEPPIGVGVLTVRAAGNSSSATAVDLDIADVIRAELIRATCDNGVGDVEILNGEIGGSALPSNPLGEGLDLLPLATVEVNRQSENEDGLLTVDALVVSVLPGGQTPDLAITPDTLDQLRTIAPGLTVPSMEQLQSEQTTVEEAPAEEAPAEEAPVDEAPAEEAPVDEAPAEEAPAEEAPAEEAPAEEAPAEEAPVDEAPAEEAPVEEPPAEEPAEPTLDDLLAQLTELNPGLEIPTAEGDALLEIIISSATCGAGEEEGPIEAPRPKPVETQLPVTH